MDNVCNFIRLCQKLMRKKYDLMEYKDVQERSIDKQNIYMYLVKDTQEEIEKMQIEMENSKSKLSTYELLIVVEYIKKHPINPIIQSEIRYIID